MNTFYLPNRLFTYLINLFIHLFVVYLIMLTGTKIICWQIMRRPKNQKLDRIFQDATADKLKALFSILYRHRKRDKEKHQDYVTRLSDSKTVTV
jgi:hypothetical protein